jgi:hypothetical protein
MRVCLWIFSGSSIQCVCANSNLVWSLPILHSTSLQMRRKGIILHTKGPAVQLAEWIVRGINIEVPLLQKNVSIL